MSQAELTRATTVAAPRRRTFDPLLLLWIVLAVVLIFLVVNPLFRLVQLSMQDSDTGAFTLMNYVAAYSRPRYLEATWNSLALGFWVTVLCLLFAVPVAWAVSRTDMPGKGAIRLLVLGAFVTPPYLGSIAWILLAGPNSGWLNRMWMALTGAHEGLFNIYSFTGLAFNIALYSFPYLFIFTTAALDVVSSEMEDAANILGAGTLRTTLQHHSADGAAGDHGRRHHHFPGSHRAVRRAGADRHSGALQRRDDTVAAILQPADPCRGGRSLRNSAAADHRRAVRRATLAGAAARLRRADRQGRRAAHHRAGSVALGDARLHHAAAVAGGPAALLGAGAGGAVEGVGPRAQPGQSDVAQFLLPAVPA